MAHLFDKQKDDEDDYYDDLGYIDVNLVCA